MKLFPKPQFHITHNQWSYPMCTFNWDPFFDPVKETSEAIAWISFPAMPKNFIGNEVVFNLAAATGKILQLDIATPNKTIPSFGSFKAELDLIWEFQKRINIGVRMKSREAMERWIHTEYDYIPKNCKTCKLQGHNEN